MKKTPFIISLLAALLGIQPALATEFEYGTENPDAKTYIGEYSETESVSYGIVSVTEGENPAAKSDYTVYGSYTSATGGSASLSTITMEGGTVAGACGGYSAEGKVAYNGVTITKGTVNGDVYGGRSASGGETEWNTVTLGDSASTNAALAEAVYGGYSKTGASWDNTVTVEANGHAAEVFGGISDDGTSHDNKVTVSGTVDNSIAGGVGTESYGNSVTIEDSAKVANSTGAQRAYIYGGSSAKDSYQNTVTISDHAYVGCDVYGGYTEGPEVSDDARQNAVVVYGGTMGEHTNLHGGYSYGRAYGNEVGIAAGSVENVYGATSVSGTAEKNRVVVAGGTVSGTLAGAMGETVKNNEVHLLGKGVQSLHLDSDAGLDSYETPDNSIIQDLDGHAMVLGHIHGAICTGNSASSSGNSIDLYGYDITAKSMSDMQVLNFHMLNAIENTSTAMLNLTSTDSRDALVLGSNLVLNFDALDEMTWHPGDSVTLVSSKLGINVDPYLLSQEYKIYQYTDTEKEHLSGTGVLKLEQGGTVLKLVVPMVPEPATGVLSLLGLALLANRRRRR